MPTSHKLAERMKAEIIRDVVNGVVPFSVQSFAHLHDYVDANCYGGAEALLEEFYSQFPDTEAGHSKALDLMTDLMNAAINIVDEWIKTRHLNEYRNCEYIRRNDE